MKTLTLPVIVLSISLALLAQGSDEPYPGQSEHREPPKGWYCTPDAAQPAHRCACKNMAKDKDDPICKKPEPEDDPQCRSYCWKSHCLCQIKCE
jgi:hypothetical protein